MSEFTPIHAVASGGTSPRPGGKMKWNKKTIALYGGLGIGAFLLISNLFKGNSSSSEAGGTTVEDYPNPTNSADVQSDMQNYQSILSGQLETGFNQMGTDLYNDQQSYKDQMDILLETQKQNYETQIQQQQDKYDSFAGNQEEVTDKLQTQLNAAAKKAADDLAAFKKADATSDAKTQAANAAAIKAAQDKATAASKAAATAKAKADAAIKAAAAKKATPAPTKTTTTAKQALINKIDSNYKGASIVDYLKAAGTGNSMADRKKIASTLGIKNYTGTSAQNTAMLKTLKSDGK